MLGKKPFRLLVLGSLLSSVAAYAGHAPAFGTGLEVFIPPIKPGFGFSISALALKPGASNLNYTIFNNELPVQSPSWIEQELKPNYTPAFRLEGRYIFPEGKDITLNWTHLNASTNSTIFSPNFDFFVGPDYEIGPDALTNRNANGSVHFNYNVVNLEAAQYVEIGRNVMLRFFGGLSTASLGEKVNSTVTGDIVLGDFPGPFSSRSKVTSNFYGVGPRFGITADLFTACGFGLMGEAAVSALIGNSHSKTEFFESSAELLELFGQTQNYQTIKDQRVTQVIPGFETKLGVNFKRELSNGTMLTIEAGYQAAVYINAISQWLPGSLVGDSDFTALDTGGIFVATMDHRLSNYSVHGPFFSVNLQF